MILPKRGWVNNSAKFRKTAQLLGLGYINLLSLVLLGNSSVFPTKKNVFPNKKMGNPWFFPTKKCVSQRKNGESLVFPNKKWAFPVKMFPCNLRRSLAGGMVADHEDGGLAGEDGQIKPALFLAGNWIYSYIYIYMYVYIYLCIYIYMYIYNYMYVYIYIYYTYKLELITADFVGYGPKSLHYPILKHSQFQPIFHCR